MNWRPLADPPQARVPVTALVATRDVDHDDFYMLGFYVFRRGSWCNEDTGVALVTTGEHWWIAENELMHALERQVHERATRQASA